ncbi:hypothetical protein [Planifilum fimeticola]
MRLFLAIFLTLLLPGLGQLVNGHRWKGIVFIGLDFVGIVLNHTVSEIPVYLLYAVALVDAAIFGFKVQRGKLEAPKGRKFVLEVVVISILSILITGIFDEWMIQYRPNPFEELQNLGEPSEEEKQQVKKEAEQYLKERYGEEFYVDDLHYIWQTNRWSMRGHLTNEKGWDFWVSKYNGQFKDAYFTHRISRDAEEEIKPQIEEAFDSLINWDTSVGIPEEIEDQYAKSIPSYQELREKTKRYKQTITIALATSLTEKNQEQEFEEVYRLVSYLNQNNIRADMEIFYYDPSIKEKGIKKVDFTRSGYYQEYLTGLLEINDVSKVKTAKDIGKYLK